MTQKVTLLSCIFPIIYFHALPYYCNDNSTTFTAANAFPMLSLQLTLCIHELQIFYLTNKNGTLKDLNMNKVMCVILRWISLLPNKRRHAFPPKNITKLETSVIRGSFDLGTIGALSLRTSSLFIQSHIKSCISESAPLSVSRDRMRSIFNNFLGNMCSGIGDLRAFDRRENLLILVPPSRGDENFWIFV